MVVKRVVQFGLLSGLAGVLSGCPPLIGEDFFDGFGLAIEDVGDLNGDLIHELACGAPDGMGEDGVIYGEVRVYSGISGGRVRNWVGTSPHSRFGSAIAGVGDMNGDGFGDVLVGAPRHSVTDFQMRGRAVVHSGIDGSILHEWFGESIGSEFGLGVASAGDYDGDEVPDAMVAAWQQPGLWGAMAGKVYIYSGADGTELANFEGSAEGERLGARVAYVGDLDGDDVGDLLMSTAPVDTGGGEGAAPKAIVPSRVYVYTGGTGLLHATLFAEAVRDNFGIALAAMGDVDGDG
ncbi:MAG: FG-GAP repeat protein, partial [Myxococcales bacterium]|nr:FG-GAP repeat protein [Myxococcales bacterium]